MGSLSDACLFSGVEERYILFCIRKIQAGVITCRVTALLRVTQQRYCVSRNSVTARRATRLLRVAHQDYEASQIFGILCGSVPGAVFGDGRATRSPLIAFFDSTGRFKGTGAPVEAGDPSPDDMGLWPAESGCAGVRFLLLYLQA
jgi:hypothetical protein